MKTLRLQGHKLETFTTTIAQAGAHVTTGRCTCGWSVECTFVREVKSEYRKHISQKVAQSK